MSLRTKIAIGAVVAATVVAAASYFAFLHREEAQLYAAEQAAFNALELYRAGSGAERRAEKKRGFDGLIKAVDAALEEAGDVQAFPFFRRDTGSLQSYWRSIRESVIGAEQSEFLAAYRRAERLVLDYNAAVSSGQTEGERMVAVLQLVNAFDDALDELSDLKPSHYPEGLDGESVRENLLRARTAVRAGELIGPYLRETGR